MYRLLSFCKKERPGVMAGFIHLPYAAECLPEGKDAFAMPLAKIRQALEISIYEIMEKASDKNGVTGKIERVG